MLLTKAAVALAETNPSVFPMTEENNWGTVCVARTVTQYAMLVMPGAVGGQLAGTEQSLAWIVTFWRPPKPPSVKPFVAA